MPGKHIQETLNAFQGSARLSGTVTPAHVFQRVHGFAEDGDALSSSGLAFAEQLGVFVVPNVSTYYRSRERTVPELVRLIDGVSAAPRPATCSSPSRRSPTRRPSPRPATIRDYAARCPP